MEVLYVEAHYVEAHHVEAHHNGWSKGLGRAF